MEEKTATFGSVILSKKKSFHAIINVQKKKKTFPKTTRIVSGVNVQDLLQSASAQGQLL